MMQPNPPFSFTTPPGAPTYVPGVGIVAPNTEVLLQGGMPSMAQDAMVAHHILQQQPPPPFTFMQQAPVGLPQQLQQLQQQQSLAPMQAPQYVAHGPMPTQPAAQQPQAVQLQQLQQQPQQPVPAQTTAAGSGTPPPSSTGANTTGGAQPSGTKPSVQLPVARRKMPGAGNHAPSPEELQAARILRGAPVICGSNGARVPLERSSASTLAGLSLTRGSMSPGGSGQSQSNPGDALLQVGDSLAAPAASADAVVEGEKGGLPPLTPSNSTPDHTSPTFRVVRRLVTPVQTNKLSMDELIAAVRKAIAATPAEVFVPLAAVSKLKPAMTLDKGLDFRRNSVGEIVDAIVAVLGDHQAVPDGFETTPSDAGPQREDMPLVSTLRLVLLFEQLSKSHEHFKTHATRTLLNLVADVNTVPGQRLCAAAMLGMLFRFGIFGANDPYQALVDILQPFGRLESQDVAFAVVRLIEVCECPQSAAKAVLGVLLESTAVRFVGDSPTTAEPSPAALDVTAEAVKRGAAVTADTGSVSSVPPPPPYSVATSMLSNSGSANRSALLTGSGITTAPASGPSNTSSHETETLAELRSRTVYVTRVDPAMSEGELRNVILDCGDFNKVRLCGDTPGRCKYCFVEFAAEAGAKRMLLQDNRWFGNQQLRVSMAKAAIETNDPRDALFDTARGKVRACIFGLSQNQSRSTTEVSNKPLNASSPGTLLTARLSGSERRHGSAQGAASSPDISTSGGTTSGGTTSGGALIAEDMHVDIDLNVSHKEESRVTSLMGITDRALEAEPPVADLGASVFGDPSA